MIATIGILGGGQLGRMLTLEAKRMGYRVVTLEPLPNSPTGQVADEQIVAAYDDPRAIGELGARSDVTTYEFENIPLESVRLLEQEARLVRPNAAVLRITQDRVLEKTFVRDCGIGTAPFAPVEDARDLAVAAGELGFPAGLKTARPGGGKIGFGHPAAPVENGQKPSFARMVAHTAHREGGIVREDASGTR